MSNNWRRFLWKKLLMSSFAANISWRCHIITVTISLYTLMTHSILVTFDQAQYGEFCVRKRLKKQKDEPDV